MGFVSKEAWKILCAQQQIRIKELEAENTILRQQRDAANAQLDFLIEEVKTRTED